MSNKNRIDEINRKVKLLSSGGERYLPLVKKLLAEKEQLEMLDKLAEMEVEEEQKEVRQCKDGSLLKMYNELMMEWTKVEAMEDAGRGGEIGKATEGKIARLLNNCQAREKLNVKIGVEDFSNVRPECLGKIIEWSAKQKLDRMDHSEVEKEVEQKFFMADDNIIDNEGSEE